MKVSKAATIWIDYHRAHSKKKYGSILQADNRSVLSGIR